MPACTAVSIGTFDGVHLGHARIVTEARKLVGSDGRVIILCFDPHPQVVLRPDSAPPRLSTFNQKRKWLLDIGADEVIQLEPTRELLNHSAEEFIKSVVQSYCPGFVIEGKDFRFGKTRSGSIETLKELGTRHNFKAVVVETVEAITTDQAIVKVSSSMTRWFIRHGRVRDAEKMLGRPFEIMAAVVEGDRRGRTLNVPTANLEQNDYLLPADGVYAGVATDPDGNSYPAALSVGTKPMFDGETRLCEAHLIGYDGPVDNYGWTITVQFVDWLRDQLCFDSVDLLVSQIHRDIKRVETCAQLGAVAV